MPDTGEVFLLPPTLVNRLVEASTVTGWRSSKLLGGPVLGDGDRYGRLAVNLLCHAYRLGWSRSTLLALADWIETHRCAATDADGHDLVDTAVWLVDGGPSMWKTGEARRPSTPTLSAADAAAYLTALERVALDHAWTGRTGQTDRAVFLHLVRHGLSGGLLPTVEPLAPTRTVAELTNMDPATAKRALRRLRESGYLLPVGLRGETEATSYLVRWPGQALAGPATPPCGSVLEAVLQQIHVGALPDLAHPAFHRSCLGRAGHRLLEVLVRFGPFRSVDDWRAAVGGARSSFFDVKRDLIEFGVVERSVDGWRPVGNLAEVLDQLGKASGADRRVAARRTAIDRDRQAWARRQGGSEVQPMTDDGRAIDPLTGEIAAPPAEGPTPLRQCRACGGSTRDVHPVLGVPLHDGCRFPAWVARIERANGVPIPDELVRLAAAPDWGEFAGLAELPGLFGSALVGSVAA